MDVKEVHHPATFSPAVVTFVRDHHLLPERGSVLDPFAGVGTIHDLATATRVTVGIEIEPEWAEAHPNTLCGNALSLPFGAGAFDAAFTSPCYGNRMADHHTARDGSTRRSYTHDLRRTTGDERRRLHHDNAGTLYAWQSAYWDFHRDAWAELARVLRHGATFVLNVSDFIRSRQRVAVVRRHRELVAAQGFRILRQYRVVTPRMRYGENREARVEAEMILVFKKAER